MAFLHIFNLPILYPVFLLNKITEFKKYRYTEMKKVYIVNTIVFFIILGLCYISTRDNKVPLENSKKIR